MAKQQHDLNGLLVVDKPGLLAGTDPAAAGYLLTSHDVVQRVRRWSGQRRIGHTGTLDPMASGVLVLCLGTATRLVEYYQGHDKHYAARVCLGVETDSYDAVGAVVERCNVPSLDHGQIESVLLHFQGAIQQRPPVYSALKQGGESLHRKARRGEEVTVEAREVVIHNLTLTDYMAPAQIDLHVHCAAGTYVRSLAHDLGKALDSCAHLAALRREAVGDFTLAQAHPLEKVEAAAAQGALADLLLPAGVGLLMPALPLDRTSSERLGYGQKLWLPAPHAPTAVNNRVQGVDSEGRLLGILRVLEAADDGTALLYKAEKWLAPQANQT